MAGLPDEAEVGTGIGDAIGQVAEDAKAYALAQVDVAKAVAAARFRAAKAGLILGVTAVLLAGSALTALLVGLIIALSTLTGPLLATAIVVVVVLAIAGILGARAASSLSRAFGGGA
ncbi:phage holin family protein [Sphingomonas floccifaciens]|uniref:Phage holin family protein n=1 Tax=Sphingomonas floccifaciens TaxID=1844115 RepID=A0ABW4NAN9_9SPHN